MQHHRHRNGMIAISTTIRIMPPAMPKMPEINDVASTAAASSAAKSKVIMATSRVLERLVERRAS
ncbi:hypothetical protein EN812_14190 [Mesorhizobium sp. M4B.F.Ca.ET.169.01.1.1]|uniref:hypothetical protein n=1 Tax=Mesorhizobium sp. M4B.F.Ca.ET.169.01.1.1 TaxID=2563949 RepID=UPI001093A8DB|nr:hypothetical protein [Mesorhizobium sp. M4B.F.Ca.ET.169.01.1.1]TGT43244.1 hypothetical protein EN812_14190 [Mesorhizobium sp. M4B.F.Ca.ET.169.01.1.1]